MSTISITKEPSSLSQTSQHQNQGQLISAYIRLNSKKAYLIRISKKIMLGKLYTLIALHLGVQPQSILIITKGRIMNQQNLSKFTTSSIILPAQNRTTSLPQTQFSLIQLLIQDRQIFHAVLYSNIVQHPTLTLRIKLLIKVKTSSNNETDSIGNDSQHHNISTPRNNVSQQTINVLGVPNKDLNGLVGMNNSGNSSSTFTVTVEEKRSMRSSGGGSKRSVMQEYRVESVDRTLVISKFMTQHLDPLLVPLADNPTIASLLASLPSSPSTLPPTLPLGHLRTLMKEEAVLVYTGRILSTNKTLQEEFVENHAEIVVTFRRSLDLKTLGEELRKLNDEKVSDVLLLEGGVSSHEGQMKEMNQEVNFTFSPKKVEYSGQVQYSQEQRQNQQEEKGDEARISQGQQEQQMELIKLQTLQSVETPTWKQRKLPLQQQQQQQKNQDQNEEDREEVVELQANHSDEVEPQSYQSRGNEQQAIAGNLIEPHEQLEQVGEGEQDPHSLELENQPPHGDQQYQHQQQPSVNYYQVIKASLQQPQHKQQQEQQQKQQQSQSQQDQSSHQPTDPNQSIFHKNNHPIETIDDCVGTPIDRLDEYAEDQQQPTLTQQYPPSCQQNDISTSINYMSPEVILAMQQHSQPNTIKEQQQDEEDNDNENYQQNQADQSSTNKLGSFERELMACEQKQQESQLQKGERESGSDSTENILEGIDRFEDKQNHGNLVDVEEGGITVDPENVDYYCEGGDDNNKMDDQQTIQPQTHTHTHTQTNLHSLQQQQHQLPDQWTSFTRVIDGRTGELTEDCKIVLDRMVSGWQVLFKKRGDDQQGDVQSEVKEGVIIGNLQSLQSTPQHNQPLGYQQQYQPKQTHAEQQSPAQPHSQPQPLPSPPSLPLTPANNLPFNPTTTTPLQLLPPRIGSQQTIPFGQDSMMLSSIEMLQDNAHKEEISRREINLYVESYNGNLLDITTNINVSGEGLKGNRGEVTMVGNAHADRIDREIDGQNEEKHFIRIKDESEQHQQQQRQQHKVGGSDVIGKEGQQLNEHLHEDQPEPLEQKQQQQQQYQYKQQQQEQSLPLHQQPQLQRQQPPMTFNVQLHLLASQPSSNTSQGHLSNEQQENDFCYQSAPHGDHNDGQEKESGLLEGGLKNWGEEQPGRSTLSERRVMFYYCEAEKEVGGEEVEKEEQQVEGQCYQDKQQQYPQHLQQQQLQQQQFHPISYHSQVQQEEQPHINPVLQTNPQSLQQPQSQTKHQEQNQQAQLNTQEHLTQQLQAPYHHSQLVDDEHNNDDEDLIESNPHSELSQQEIQKEENDPWVDGDRQEQEEYSQQLSQQIQPKVRFTEGDLLYTIELDLNPKPKLLDAIAYDYHDLLCKDLEEFVETFGNIIPDEDHGLNKEAFTSDQQRLRFMMGV